MDVIIVSFQSGEHLAILVRQLLHEELPKRIIVVDNASTDGSLAALPSDPRLQVFRLNQNVGFAAAINVGLQSVASASVLVLNPDVSLEPKSLDHLQRSLDEIPRAVLIGAWVVNSDGSEQRGTRRRLPTPWRALMTFTGLERVLGGRLRLFRGVNLNYGPVPRSPRAVEAINGACMLFRASALRQIAGFDERFFLHCEDLDVCRRLLDEGYEIWLQPAARVQHFQGISSSSVPARVSREKLKSMRYYATKHSGGTAESILWKLFGVVGAVRERLMRSRGER